MVKCVRVEPRPLRCARRLAGRVEKSRLVSTVEVGRNGSGGQAGGCRGCRDVAGHVSAALEQRGGVCRCRVAGLDATCMAEPHPACHPPHGHAPALRA